ncbi:hypothetical protein AB0D88_24130 [Streptomyces werraensis]|uniref:hypothetical protein n=1 Tax=Streptomyces werraensis TaxID=68284 RepID=UPI00342A308A
MIVPSRLLGNLLEQIDQKRAAYLALDFAQHVLDLERDEIEEPVSVACLEYMDAAHEAIGLGAAAGGRPAEGGQPLPPGRGRGLHHGRGAGRCRVNAGQGARARPVQSPVLPVRPRQLQAEAGRWAARHRDDDVDERLAARRARWEEARWQVRHVIASEPNPHGDA